MERQGVEGEALVGGPIQPLLQGAQHGCSVGGGAHPQQAEMVDRQVQAGAFSKGWTVGRVCGFGLVCDTVW